MTFGAYLRYVRLSILCLCMMPCLSLQAQMQRNRTSETRILLVMDRDTGLPIGGAYVLMGNHTFVSSSEGEVTVPEAITLQDTVAVQSLGYKSQKICLKEVSRMENVYTVSLIQRSEILEEVVVTGERGGILQNTVGHKLVSSVISRAFGTSLSALLEQVAGVSSISTGTTVAKPVIQGMFGNRILIVNNDTRQTGQQWGIDHAPEVDMNSSNSIQVIKGADAIRYGSDALGGAILMLPALLPFHKKGLCGKVASLYGSNGRSYMLTGQLEGTFPFSGDFAWRVQGTYVNSGDHSTAHYLLNNTGSREQHFSTSLGYDHKKLRIEGFYSRFDNKLGGMLSAQMGSEDMLAERILLGRPVYIEPYTRNITYPYQRVTHQTVIGKLKYQTALGYLSWQTAWQEDDRRENRIRRLNHSNIPAVSLLLSSFQNLFRWNWDYGSWQTEIGGQIMFIDNHSRGGTGVVPVIPNYTETQMGIYGVQKLCCHNGGLEVGVRFDRQETRASGYDWTGNHYGGTRKFANIAYNLGGHYILSNYWKFTSNFGVAWRAPHVYELYSNGNELGSGMFVKGDSTMHSERGYKWISSITYQNKMLSIRIDGYLQWINGYIYDEPQKETVTVISGVYPVFKYKQSPTFFRGIDFDCHIMPFVSWDYHAVASIIRANERISGNYLPYIPSFHFTHELAWMYETGFHSQLRLGIRHRFVAKQTHFEPDADLIPYTPPAYHLFGFDASFEYPVKHGHKLCFILSIDNIFNKEYKEYTNRSRYYAHDMGRDIRCSLNWDF